MALDRLPLDAATQAVADGESIDWDALEAAVGEEQRAAVRNLRLVAAIADVHRSATESTLSPASPAPVDTPAPDLASPRAWGPLVILERLGGGVYGDVYRARDPRLDREVALKLLRLEPIRDAAVGQAIVEEARLLARVRHPHVVTVYGADRFDDRSGLWMECIHGRSLDQELLERGPFGPGEAAVVGLAVCAALAAVHQAGLVHRDVKAGNVMREGSGRIVLMDFGAGCAAFGAKGPRDGGLVGTPLYAAPEVLAGKPATSASDIYSAGVLLFYLVTGSHPVVAETVDGLREAHRRKQRQRLRDARPNLPADFVAVVERALQVEPGDRFASAGEMEAALAATIVGHAAETPHPATQSGGPAETPRAGIRRLFPTTWRSWAALAATAGVLAAAAGLAYTHWPREGGAGAALGFQSRDWVLVAAFDNRTGDPLLDGTVEYAVARELENSHYVNVVPRERIGDSLGLMRKRLDSRLDEGIAREVCLRDGGIRAMVSGRIEKLGDVFAISARVTDPTSGQPIAGLFLEAPSKERILFVVRDLSRQVRLSLGEARREVAASDQAALEKGVTTPSIKAWQLYAQGMSFVQSQAVDRWQRAKPLLERATEEDPEFASAWAYLSYAFQPGSPFADRAKQRAASERAFQLADHASERERLFIRATYFQNHEQLEQARNEYLTLVQRYPDHYWALNNLAAIWRDAPDTAAFVVRRAELRPANVGVNSAAAEALIRAGRPDEAGRFIERVRAIQRAEGGPRDDTGAWLRPSQLWAKNDVQGTMAVVDEEAAEADRTGNTVRRWTLNYWLIGMGRLREVDQFLLARLATIQERGADPEWVAHGDQDMPEMLLAVNALLRGDRATARVWMVRLGARLTRRDRYFGWEVAALQARLGLSAEVRRLLADPASVTQGVSRTLDWPRGELALAEGRPAEAVGLLTKSAAQISTSVYLRPLAIQGLVAALEASRQWQTELQTIEREGGPSPASGVYPALPVWLDMQLRRAKLLRRFGRDGEAESVEAEMRKYLAFADPDLLILRQLAGQTH